MKKYIFPLILLVLMISSCASAQFYKQAETLYREGEFPQSAQAVIQSLEANPKNQDALLLLEQVYPKAVRALQNRAEEATAGDNPFGWSIAADSFIFLHSLNRRYELLPPLYHKKQKRVIEVSVSYFNADLEAARDRAAAEQYQAGRDLSSAENKEDLRQAIVYFEKAMYYREEYRDSATRIAAIEDSASDFILILPQENSEKGDVLWNLDETLFNDLFAEILQGSKEKRYLRVIDRENLELILEEQKMALTGITSSDSLLQIGEISNADTLVSYTLTSLNYSAPERQTRREERSFDYLLPESHGEYNDYADHIKPVSGVVMTEENMTYLEIKVTYRIVDISTSEVKDTLTVTTKTEDSTTRIEYTGDIEILNSRERELLESWDREIMSYSELALDAEEKMAENLAREILKNFE